MRIIGVVEDTTRSTLTIPANLGRQLAGFADQACIDKITAADVLLLLMLGPLKRMISREVMMVRCGLAPTEGPGFGTDVASVNCSKMLAQQLGKYAKALRLSRNWLFYDLAALLLTQTTTLEGFDRNTIPSVIRARLKEAEADARLHHDTSKLLHPDTPAAEDEA